MTQRLDVWNEHNPIHEPSHTYFVYYHEMNATFSQRLYGAQNQKKKLPRGKRIPRTRLTPTSRTLIHLLLSPDRSRMPRNPESTASTSTSKSAQSPDDPLKHPSALLLSLPRNDICMRF